jgi:hypothetical protein
MGRRKRGSNKMGGGPALKDAVSDDDTAGGDEELGVYDDVDNWEMQRDKVLLEATTAAAGRGRQGASAAGNQREVFALSGTDSDDSDFSSVRKVKEKKRKKKKGAEKEEEGESMADSDVEEGGPEAGDDLRAWGSRKKHFYGGTCKESLFYYIVAGRCVGFPISYRQAVRMALF